MTHKYWFSFGLVWARYAYEFWSGAPHFRVVQDLVCSEASGKLAIFCEPHYRLDNGQLKWWAPPQNS